jgi:regulator of protease activity HflC (stomatin/prohibitin superfamily)
MRSLLPSITPEVSTLTPSTANGTSERPDAKKPDSGITSPPSGKTRDPYRGVILVLLAMALLGAAGAELGGQELSNPVLLDAALTLGIATGVLIGVAVAQTIRAMASSRPSKSVEEPSISVPQSAPQEDAENPPSAPTLPEKPIPEEGLVSAVRLRLIGVRDWIRHWFEKLGVLGVIRVATAAAGIFAIIRILPLSPYAMQTALVEAAIAAGVCLVAAGLAATAAHYLAEIDPARLPEGPGLCRGARLVAWILVLAAISIGWAGQETILGILHIALVLVNLALCIGLLRAKQAESEAGKVFPLDLGILSMLGSRANIAASILDAGEAQLGIDLRSTWALTVVRRGVEPLAFGLLVVGWLSTSLTVVGVEEQALVERLGVSVSGGPLEPGLHLHWPWPVDRVFRIPVRRVQTTTVGHEGEEAGGPENVLWAVEHAANEYTLLLGNGRDLITVDAAVHFRITDARAWRYHVQNPGDAMRSIAYRAVMRSTVNHTLSEVLSENVAEVTGRMKAMVQQDADALGLGIEVVAFTVGGMHPPVMVAADYQAVVSAEIAKVTAVVNAQVFHNQTVPAAEASVVMRQNMSRAEGVNALARAAGEAWSFRTLESQYRAAPQEYFFRRRLETLENVLAGRRFTIVDARFQRDGGEIWVMP